MALSWWDKAEFDAKIPEAEAVCRISNREEDQVITIGTTKIQGTMTQVDPEFFEVFPIYPLLEGSLEEYGLKGHCLVSESFARKHFTGSPIGKQLSMENYFAGEETFTVCGVYKDFVGTMMPSSDILFNPQQWFFHRGNKSVLQMLLVVVLLLLISAIFNYINLNLALFASRFAPIDIVRGTFRRRSKMVFGKVFIVFQNVVSVVLISMAIVMEVQLNHMMHRPLNARSEGLYSLGFYARDYSEVEPLVDRLNRIPEVKRVAYGRGFPGQMNMGFMFKTLDGRQPLAQVIICTPDYFDMLRLVELFMILSVLIALLGLLAMSAYYSGENTKGIAVRKVFGSDVSRETWRTVKDYMVLVGIAVVIGIPVAVWMAGRYLSRYAYRIDGYWWIFVLAAVIAVAIAFGSVLWQTLKAAKTNPAIELKKE